MNIIQLNSFCRDQTCQPVKMSVSSMRVAAMMFYWINIPNMLLF